METEIAPEASPVKPVLIEFDKTEFTPEKKKPNDTTVLRERLTSPSRKETPEQISQRHQTAERRRLDFTEAKAVKAHKSIEKGVEVRKRRESGPQDKENVVEL